MTGTSMAPDLESVATGRYGVVLAPGRRAGIARRSEVSRRRPAPVGQYWACMLRASQLRKVSLAVLGVTALVVFPAGCGSSGVVGHGGPHVAPGTPPSAAGAAAAGKRTPEAAVRA